MANSQDRLEQAAAQMQGGRWAQARSLLQRFLAAEPVHAVANGMMAFVLSREGQPGQALFFLERGLASDPGNTDLLNNLGNTHLALGDNRSAAAAFERVLAIEPTHLSAGLGLQALFNAWGRLDEAEDLSGRLLAAHPDHPRVAGNLGAVLRNAGRVEEAVTLLRRMIALYPADPLLASGLAMSLCYSDGATPEEILAAHRRFAGLLGPAGPRPDRARTDPDPERPLRVGVVSPDLRAHSVAFFIEPWLERHDRARVRVICYATANEDAVSQRLKKLVAEWRLVPGHRTDAELAEQIRRDRIDILLDLAGLTGGHRMGTFRMRPAPVQATYVGYACTTGVSEIEYRIVDSITDPPGSEGQSAERLWRLDPCFLCYRPPDGAPAPAPAGADRPVTFGSFNAVAKLSETTVRLWARVVGAAAGARLVLKNDVFACPRVRTDVEGRFAAAGLPAGVLELLPRSASIAEHLAMYERIDIALDPFPYHGTTTTCEALYMGVPVVSLRGDRHAARVGASLLRAVGLPELIADDPEGFVAAAVALASDGPRRAGLRQELRGRLLASPLCDREGLARRLDGALREIWWAWCSGG